MPECGPTPRLVGKERGALGVQAEQPGAVIPCPPACPGEAWVRRCRRDKELPLGMLGTVSLG